MSTPRPSLSPLLKWSGGKRSEIKYFRAAYPEGVEHMRVVEPFSGGAAVAFELNPVGGVVLNDLNAGLVEFYRTVADPDQRDAFLGALRTLDAARKALTKASQSLDDTLDTVWKNPLAWVQAQSPQWLSDAVSAPPLDGLPNPVAWPPSLLAKVQTDLLACVKSKVATRIPNLEARHGISFDATQRRNHLETGLQSGLYTALRRIYNGDTPPDITKAWRVAAWWFVRALCYSGMFRYGKGGKFNVPYGGIGYNSRDFLSSMRDLASPRVAGFFSQVQVNALDFDKLFDAYDGFGPNDFIFVDPPYDSEFSQYNPEGDFTRADQQRLADRLRRTKAPWLLVVKNTPFILSLYQDSVGTKLYRGTFDKRYRVNIRNRNTQPAEHLVVANYPFPVAGPNEEVGIQPLP